MEVTITTSENTKRKLVGKDVTTYTIHAKVTLTPDEALVYDSEQRRSSQYKLCEGFTYDLEDFEKRDLSDCIMLNDAIDQGDSCTAQAPSGLKAREAEIIDALNIFKSELEIIKGYEIGKSYTVTIGGDN